MVMLQFNPLGNRVIDEREMRNRWKGKVWLTIDEKDILFFSSKYIMMQASQSLFEGANQSRSLHLVQVLIMILNEGMTIPASRISDTYRLEATLLTT
eukprot:scaffold2113_cov63-Attheya_sp.AAC.7